jgi:DNA-binding response OmpR family regulator
VVEDEVVLASYVKRGLERDGYAVDIAGDGLEGLWFAGENKYDLIVLDILLPKMNGYLVCTELRKRGIWTPILMLTAKDGELDEAEALDSGADDFLTKPFSFVVLLARLRALTRRIAPDRPVIVEAGDLRLDPSAFNFWVGETEVMLSPTEFSIMQLFLRRPGEVLSKTEIVEACWDWAFDGDPNIVEVYMRRLRLKIDIPFGRQQLQTVRGAGYRLAANAQ